MKYKFNIQPVIIEADSVEDAWKIYETSECFYEVNDMEEIE